MGDNPFIGRWTYRSLLNDPKLDTGFDTLEFGRATIQIVDAAPQLLTGTIGGTGWSLNSRVRANTARRCGRNSRRRDDQQRDMDI